MRLSRASSKLRVFVLDEDSSQPVAHVPLKAVAE